MFWIGDTSFNSTILLAILGEPFGKSGSKLNSKVDILKHMRICLSSILMAYVDAV
jgi:hypothetical protein